MRSARNATGITGHHVVAVFLRFAQTALNLPVFRAFEMVELVGIEPTASSLRTTRSPS
jgi:hypothetical protein